jgi:hypothetical protein
MNLNYYEVCGKLINLNTVSKIEKGVDGDELSPERYSIIFTYCTNTQETYGFEKKICRDKIYNEIKSLSMKQPHLPDL